MIDLHCHTTHSDGTQSPAELLQEAQECGLTALAVTDHDTFGGFEEAAGSQPPAGLDLIQGIELTTRRDRYAVHVLGYFLNGPPSIRFQQRLRELLEQRGDRNIRLVRKLQDLGLDITLEEVRALGRHMTGRPHFAQVLVAKGYVRTYDEAFARYLNEDGAAYVVRDAPSVADGIGWIRQGGGLPSLAHPIRLRLSNEEEYIGQLANAGLQAVEVYHSDHGLADRARYQAIADRYGLAASGGSDYHGTIKPNVKLGSQKVDVAVLERLREIASKA